jgi:hypothetical protein
MILPVVGLEKWWRRRRARNDGRDGLNSDGTGVRP